MTDQETQRYRPLAVGEWIERGDEIFTCGSWEPAVACVGCIVTSGDAKFRRPIPETNWRDPVGEAGYPYPPGTVVEEENYALWLCSEFHEDSLAVRVHKTGDGSYQVENSIWLDKDCNRTMRHRVIDYRPDLLAQETPADETQTNLSRTDETQDLLPCPFCGPVKSVLESLRLKSHEGEETQVVHCRECGCYGPPSFHNAGQQEYYWNQRPRSEMEAELTACGRRGRWGMSEVYRCRDCETSWEPSYRTLMDSRQFRQSIRCPKCGGISDPENPSNERGYKTDPSKRRRRGYRL